MKENSIWDRDSGIGFSILVHGMKIDDDGFVIIESGDMWREVMDYTKLFGTICFFDDFTDVYGYILQRPICYFNE